MRAAARLPLSATLFGLFIDGLHDDAVPTAGTDMLQLPLRELVYCDSVLWYILLYEGILLHSNRVTLH